jgi:hypothetical protein
MQTTGFAMMLSVNCALNGREGADVRKREHRRSKELDWSFCDPADFAEESVPTPMISGVGLLSDHFSGKGMRRRRPAS